MYFLGASSCNFHITFMPVLTSNRFSSSKIRISHFKWFYIMFNFMWAPLLLHLSGARQLLCKTIFIIWISSHHVVSHRLNIAEFMHLHVLEVIILRWKKARFACITHQTIITWAFSKSNIVFVSRLCCYSNSMSRRIMGWRILYRSKSSPE